MTTLTQASAQWSRRPADERFGSIADMDRAARAFKTSAMVEDIKAKALRVAAAGDNLFLETDNTAPAVMTNWSFHQLANRAGAPAAYRRPEHCVGICRRSHRDRPRSAECLRSAPAPSRRHQDHGDGGLMKWTPDFGPAA
jgi:hypothetical protein